VALAQQEPVAVRVVHGLGTHVEHPVVEHPEHVERRRGARRVLLVAGEQGHQAWQVVVRRAGVRDSENGHER
jgi:hypothetical protein